MAENAALRALRLLDFVPFIVRNPGISIKELSEEFSVSQEEILKDLNLLFLCGLPGYTPLELIDLSFDEGSVVVRDPQNLDVPRNFNESEALALRVALATLLELTPTTHRDYKKIQRLSSKISAAFSSEIPIKAIDFVADRERQILKILERALNEGRDVQLVYNNLARDTSSNRVVTPLSISFSDERTMLEALCHTARGLRSFNLKQIKSAEIIERESEIFDEGTFSEDVTTVKMIISSDNSEFMRANQTSLTKVGEDSGNPIFEIRVFQPEWIVRSVIAEPNSLILSEPGEFRRAIVERCATALDQYGVIG